MYEETSGTSPREIREDSATILTPSWGSSWGFSWGNSWGLLFYPSPYIDTTGNSSSAIYEVNSDELITLFGETSGTVPQQIYEED